MNSSTPFTFEPDDIEGPGDVLVQTQGHSLRECVEQAMVEYFHHLDGHDCTGLYDLVIQQVEEPLLEAVMQYTRNNQSRAAALLGLNRSTLRKKLKLYGRL